jgi:hypothetical protein
VRSLAPSGWILVLRLVFWRVTLPVMRRMLTTRRLVRLVAAPRSRARDVDREALVLAIAGRLWRRSQGTCLERSIAAFGELGRLGASPLLVLGAAPERSAMVGHSWVEIDGGAVLESTDPRAHYTPLVEFDAAGNVLNAQP